MKCVYCATPNRDARRFCSRCGVMLGWSCPRCTFFNHLSEQHCGGCGASQNADASSRTALRTQEAAAPASAPSGRSAIIKGEIQQFLKEQAAAPNRDESPAPVSQDDIDSLFGR